MPETADDKRFWDRIARKYAAGKIADPAAYERTIEATKKRLKNSDVVLEFGCGTGTTALKLAPFVARYVATDVSAEMIAIVKEKAGAEGVANIEAEVATLNAAPWGDGAFDAVLGFNVLHLVQERAAVLRNVHRLLRQGGMFMSKTPSLKEINPIIRLAVPAMQAFGQAPYVAFFSTVELEREIEAAGFEIVERESHSSRKKDARPFLAARRR